MDTYKERNLVEVTPSNNLCKNLICGAWDIYLKIQKEHIRLEFYKNL